MGRLGDVLRLRHLSANGFLSAAHLADRFRTAPSSPARTQVALHIPDRNAMIGCTRDARRAGRYVAIRVTATNAIDTPT